MIATWAFNELRIFVLLSILLDDQFSGLSSEYHGIAVGDFRKSFRWA